MWCCGTVGSSSSACGEGRECSIVRIRTVCLISWCHLQSDPGSAKTMAIQAVAKDNGESGEQTENLIPIAVENPSKEPTE